MPTTDITLAIAGHADNTRANITALLADYLHLGSPNREGYYEHPDRYRQITIYWCLTDGIIPAGLMPALQLTSSILDAELHLVTDRLHGRIATLEDTVDQVLVVPNPLDTLISRLAASPNATLLINWNEGSGGDDERLIHLAHAASTVRVRDLVQGLVEILPSEDPEPQGSDALETPPQAVVPEPRRQPQELRPARRELDSTPVPVQTTIAVGPVHVEVSTLRELLNVLTSAAKYVRATDDQNALRNRATVTIASPLTAALEGQVAVLESLVTQDVAYKDVPQATKAPATTPAPTRPVRVIWDEDSQEWRKAGRGRVRVGTRTGTQHPDGTVVEDAA